MVDLLNSKYLRKKESQNYITSSTEQEKKWEKKPYSFYNASISWTAKPDERKRPIFNEYRHRIKPININILKYKYNENILQPICVSSKQTRLV